MGYMTTYNFANNSYEEIINHPDETIEAVLDAMDNSKKNMKSYKIGNYNDAIVANRTAHADIARVYFTWKDSFAEIGGYNMGDSISVEERKKNLKEMKKILRQENKIIKKLEGKEKIDYKDLLLKPYQHITYGKYTIHRNEEIDEYITCSFKNKNEMLFKGNMKDTINFVNSQIS